MAGTVVSLLPPLVAILLCILLKRAVLALFAGIFVGAILLNEYNPFYAFLRSFDDIIWTSLYDRDHIINLLFTTFIGGLVGVFNYSPAAQKMLRYLTSLLDNRRRTSLTVWLSGFIFFIDDYANSLIVGNTFRSISDKFKISREKLAYIVDTTSAPVASLALVSTWIGFEISVIQDAVTAEGLNYSGYGLFLSSMPYRFYPLLAIFFCFLICWTQKDFSAMRKAEEKAINVETSGNTEPKEETTSTLEKKYWLVLLPLFLLVLSSILMMAYSGSQNGAETDWNHPWQSLINLYSEADPFLALLYATLFSCAVSFLLHSLIIGETFTFVAGSWLKGCKTMLIIDVILILAWSIGDVCTRLETGAFVAQQLSSGFDPHFLPLLTFLCAAAISFATGTSFGTMSILMPIVLPIVAQFGVDQPDILYGTVGSVLGGAIFGDHCSPLSDTTILSSGASGCELTAHVNTQLPYALSVAAISVCCLLLVPFESIPPLFLLAIGFVVVFGVIHYFGRTVKPDIE